MAVARLRCSPAVSMEDLRGSELLHSTDEECVCVNEGELFMFVCVCLWLSFARATKCYISGFTCGSFLRNDSLALCKIPCFPIPMFFFFVLFFLFLNVSSSRSRTPQICTFPTCLCLWMRKSWRTCCSPSARWCPRGSCATTAGTAGASASPGRSQSADDTEPPRFLPAEPPLK